MNIMFKNRSFLENLNPFYHRYFSYSFHQFFSLPIETRPRPSSCIKDTLVRCWVRNSHRVSLREQLQSTFHSSLFHFVSNSSKSNSYTLSNARHLHQIMHCREHILLLHLLRTAGRGLWGILSRCWRVFLQLLPYFVF